MTLQANKQQWTAVAQTFELDWWRQPVLQTQHEHHLGISGQIMQRFGFRQDEFAGRTVLDVGCGPTSRLSWLRGGNFVALDPLAEEYRRLGWPGSEQYTAVYAVPAEQRVPALEGTVDMLFCINCLDHCYDAPEALSNFFCYLKPGGRAFISSDVDKRYDDPTHPLQFTRDELHCAIVAAGFQVRRTDAGTCYPSTPKWLQAWGGGLAAHWWLGKKGTENA